MTIAAVTNTPAISEFVMTNHRMIMPMRQEAGGFAMAIA
jgi:hypothetical protein